MKSVKLSQLAELRRLRECVEPTPPAEPAARILVATWMGFVFGVVTGVALGLLLWACFVPL